MDAASTLWRPSETGRKLVRRFSTFIFNNRVGFLVRIGFFPFYAKACIGILMCCFYPDLGSRATTWYSTSDVFKVYFFAFWGVEVSFEKDFWPHLRVFAMDFPT